MIWTIATSRARAESCVVVGQDYGGKTVVVRQEWDRVRERRHACRASSGLWGIERPAAMASDSGAWEELAPVRGSWWIDRY